MEEPNNDQQEAKAALNRGRVPNVILVGGTGSGKSTIGQHLAQLLGFGFLDLDKMIEQRANKPVSAIFSDDGEAAFRFRESEAIVSLAKIQNHVIVPGSGAVENQENFEALKKLGPLIWLATPLTEVVNRLLMKPDEIRKRPLLAEAVNIEKKEERRDFLKARLEEMLNRRIAYYQKADKTLVSCFSTPETAAQMIKSLLIDKDHPQAANDSL